jgi:hypothetical protein
VALSSRKEAWRKSREEAGQRREGVGRVHHVELEVRARRHCLWQGWRGGRCTGSRQESLRWCRLKEGLDNGDCGGLGEHRALEDLLPPEGNEEVFIRHVMRWGPTAAGDDW